MFVPQVGHAVKKENIKIPQYWPFMKGIHLSSVDSLHKGPDRNSPDSKLHGANMGPTWVLSAPDGPHVGPTNLAIRDGKRFQIILRLHDPSLKTHVSVKVSVHGGLTTCHHANAPATHLDGVMAYIKRVKIRNRLIWEKKYQCNLYRLLTFFYWSNISRERLLHRWFRKCQLMSLLLELPNWFRFRKKWI